MRGLAASDDGHVLTSSLSSWKTISGSGSSLAWGGGSSSGIADADMDRDVDW